jgi:hypothetical protein
MPPKAVDARKRFNRNHRFRGHGPPLGPLARGGVPAWSTNKGRTPCISPRGAPPIVARVMLL